ELLGQLRRLADEPLLTEDAAGPLAQHYRDTAAMSDVALRTVQAFPDAPSAQLRLCEGLEAALGTVAERLAYLPAALNGRRQETDRIAALAEFLTAVHAGKLLDMQPFILLAEAIHAEVQEGEPLRFLDSPLMPGEPTTAKTAARAVAMHSLTVAQVLARLVRHD